MSTPAGAEQASRSHTGGKQRRGAPATQPPVGAKDRYVVFISQLYVTGGLRQGQLAGPVGSGPRGRALWHGAEQQGTSLSHQRCPSEQTPSDLEVAVGETHCFTHPPEPRKPVAIPPRLQLTAKFLPCCLPLCAYVLMSHPLEISNKTSKVGKDILREREEIGHISFLEDWPCVGPN